MSSRDVSAPSRGALLRSAVVGRSVGVVLVFVALMTWAFASPVGATPDEDYHLVSTWCANGVRDGLCEPGSTAETRIIPWALVVEAPCFAFHPEVGAACQDPGLVVDRMVESDRGNFVGDYPPVFYAFMGLFVGHDIDHSVLSMRTMNALVFMLMMAATYLAAPVGLRRALLVGSAVTIVPLGMFLVPSINPSSWTILSGMTLLVSVLGYLTTDSAGRRRVLGTLAAVSLLLGAGSRADAAMYAVVAICAALVVAFRGGRSGLKRAVYPVCLAVVAGVSYLSAGQSSALDGATEHPLSLTTVAALFTDVPELWVGALGKWGLGWLDTGLPPLVWVASFGVYFAVLFLGVGELRRRQGLAAGFVLAAVWLVPAYVQFLTGVPVGAYVQPRYILPLLTILVVVVVSRLGTSVFTLAPAQRWLLVIALSMANSVAMYTNLRRYVTGVSSGTVSLDSATGWWWDGVVISPLGMWVIGSVAFGLGLLLVTRELADPGLDPVSEPLGGVQHEVGPAGPVEDVRPAARG